MQEFETLLRPEAESLTIFLRALLRYADDRTTALDDAFQETVLVAWRRFEEFDAQRPFGAWLRGIGRRVVQAYWRQSAKAANVAARADSDALLDGLESRFDVIAALSSQQQTPLTQALHVCLEKLQASFRDTLVLHYWNEWALPRVAETLAISVDVARKRVQRGRDALRQCLQQTGLWNDETAA